MLAALIVVLSLLTGANFREKVRQHLPTEDTSEVSYGERENLRFDNRLVT